MRGAAFVELLDERPVSCCGHRSSASPLVRGPSAGVDVLAEGQAKSSGASRHRGAREAITRCKSLPSGFGLLLLDCCVFVHAG